MSVVSLESVAVSFGASDIFEGISCEASRGDRIGLVGRNGAGKTTLLRVIAGVEGSSRGRRRIERGATSALVEQIAPGSRDGTTVRQEALSAMRGVLALQVELEEAAHALAGGDEAAAERYAELLERLEAEGGFNYESQLSQVLLGLGFAEADWDKTVSSLSGGQRNRLAIATALLTEPAVLLMDEPTNHLDLRGLQWLEGFLRRWPGTLIVTSHDRHFLDAVTTKIWHMDQGGVKVYPGNYTKSEELRRREEERAEKEYRAQQEFIESEEDFIRRYGAGQRAREAKGREKRLARVERLSAPVRSKTASLRFTASRSGDLVLGTEDVSVGYNASPVLRLADLELLRGMRVALVGGNGTGKSTLLKTIAGELPPVAGSLRIGAAVQVAHYWQEAENLHPESTVLEELLREGGLQLQEARNMLGRFLFSGYDVDKRVAMLSGGERSRLALARLVLAEGNLLLLDEPTNHLDIPSREALEEALANYPGTLLFASHDRRFISRIATHVWVIEEGSLAQFEGSLEDYDQLVAAGKPNRVAPPKPAPPERPDREERHRQTAIEALEVRIAEQEGVLQALGAEVNAASEQGDTAAVGEVGARYQAVQAELDRLLAEWTDLAG